MSTSTADDYALWNYIISIVEKGSAADLTELNRAYAYSDVLAGSLKSKILRTAESLQSAGTAMPITVIGGAVPPPLSPQIPRVPPIGVRPTYAGASPAPGVPAPQLLSSQTTEVGQAHFDPDPVRNVAFTPGVPQRRTVTGPYGPGGRQATVSGVYTPPGRLITTTTDISNHPVIPAAGSTAVAAPSFSSIRMPSPIVTNPTAVESPGDPSVEVIQPVIVPQPGVAVVPAPRTIPITVRSIPQPTIVPTQIYAPPPVPTQIYAPPPVVEPIATAPTVPVVSPIYAPPAVVEPAPVYVPQAQPYIAVPSMTRFTY